MRSEYLRHRILANLTGAGALLLVITATPRSSAIYAQEESFSVTPAVTDGDTDAGWELASAPPEEPAAESVLELPQVVAVNHTSATGGAGAAGAPEQVAEDGAGDDQASDGQRLTVAPEAGSPDDLVNYTGQLSTSDDQPGDPAPITPLSSTSVIVVYSFVGANSIVSLRSGRPVGPAPSQGSFPRISPMLATSPGNRVMGGWWQRVH